MQAGICGCVINPSSAQAVIFNLCAVKTNQAVITANKSVVSL